jgi:osmotically-inducible protein OsmY
MILAIALAVPLVAYAADNAADVHRAPADNTGKNVRDRDDTKLVPTDQEHGSDADVELTRKIRQAVVADDKLSTNAHNVKIVTLNGVATLRGPVASGAEQTRVVELAAQAAGGPAHIKNELEVAP